MVDDLFISIEALRNGFKALQEHVVPWLEVSISSSATTVGAETLLCFWQAMGVPPELCNQLADRGVFSRTGR